MKTLIFLLFLLAQPAFSYPEMVRHGYPACATCHTSPDGGGVLTEYGRVLSEQLLSTWAKEGEGRFLYGAVSFPNWISMNGDVRFVETYNKPVSTPATSSLIFMEADLETALRYDKFELVGTLGYQDDQGSTFPDMVLSRRHYLMYRPTEKSSIRAGRFFSAYGLRTPDHIQETERNLGWDERGETYNLEIYYLGESYEVFLTGILGRPDSSVLDVEKGAALRGALFHNDKSKFGASFYVGSNALQSREVYGPYAIFGITPKMVALLEADIQHLTPAGGTMTTGLFTYAKLSYEVAKGVLPFLSQENGLEDLSARGNTYRYTYGIGLQWFPRPHFDFQITLQHQNRSAPRGDRNYGWLMMHAYL